MENEEIVLDIKIEPDDDTNKSNEQFSPLTENKSIVAQDIGNIDIKVENTIDKKIHVIQSLHQNNGNLRSTANHIQHKPLTHTVNAFHEDFEHQLHKEIGNTIKNDEFYAWDKHTGDTSVCGFSINYCPDQHAENSLNQTLICSNEIYDSHKALKIKQELTGDVNTEICQPYKCTDGNSIAEVCSEIANENDTCKQQTVNWSHVFIPCQAECVDNKIKQEQNEEFDMEICQARGTSADTNANNGNALRASKEANLDNPLLFGYEKTCSGAFQIKIETHEMPEEDDCLVKDERNECEFKSLLSRKLLTMDSSSEDELESAQATARQDSDCAVCGKSFKTKSGLQRHVSVHGAFEFQCEVCDKEFHNKYNLKDHMKRKHTAYQNICSQCAKTFTTQYSLKRHERIVHEKTPMFKCSLCEKVFSCKEVLNAHCTQHTTVEKPYMCSKCGRGFLYKYTLMRHMKSCSSKPQKPKPAYVCEICQKQFRFARLLKQHKRVHETPRFSCHICGKTFVWNKGLHVHLKACHVELQSSQQ